MKLNNNIFTVYQNAEASDIKNIRRNIVKRDQ